MAKPCSPNHRGIKRLLQYSFFLMVAAHSGCTKKKGVENNDKFRCSSAPLLRPYTQNEMTAAFADSIIQRLGSAAAPDNAGAMSRNRAGYFHVRFQNGIHALASYAVDSRRTDMLEATVRAIEYSFRFQKTSGDFELVVPAVFSNLPPATDADLSSGVAFFAASLGPALLALESSDWYKQNNNAVFRQRIEALMPRITMLLQWLKTKQAVLQRYDAAAPNRLLFDALAYYSLGRLLNDATARTLGLNMAQLAVAAQHANGYFIEGGGWDSSYQGVALSVGFQLLLLLQPGESFAPVLWNSLSCGSNWQNSRVQTNGAISTVQNTRVYPGGEQFLGEEKQMAWTSSMHAFFCMSFLAQQNQYAEAAYKMIAFYKN